MAFQVHNHPLEQLTIPLALHQQAADELGGNLLGRAGEEGLGEGLGEVGGYGGGFGVGGGGLKLLAHLRNKALCIV